ncbi:MAG: sigma-54 dependent transcriptional regulator [Candidatus Wallbacteria bacterium]|nr:sigma-54 dependent transcriptional regulator [Candidatus Wallbacteria bacterium]
MKSESPLYSGYGSLIGLSPKMREIYELIEMVAEKDSTVLIEGESGTGKDLVARTIHERSLRQNKPLITVNCGSLTESLLESELFGYKKGAFTGADHDKVGLFEAADGSTIFLDEISETSTLLQIRLLRVVQFREVVPVGDVHPKPVDVRIIAASNRDLNQEVLNGRFRQDLYYRLNIVDIKLPTLRERLEDLPMLVLHFLTQITERIGRKLPKIDKNAMALLQDYSWPGNIRELENVVEKSVVLTKSDIITDSHIRKVLPVIRNNEEIVRIAHTYSELRKLKKQSNDKIEHDFVCLALRRSRGIVSRAARDVGMDRGNFQKLIHKLNIDPERYRL